MMKEGAGDGQNMPSLAVPGKSQTQVICNDELITVHHASSWLIGILAKCGLQWSGQWR